MKYVDYLQRSFKIQQAEKSLGQKCKLQEKKCKRSHSRIKNKKTAIYAQKCQANNGIIEFAIRSVSQEKITQCLNEIM